MSEDDGGPAFPLPDSDEYVREFGAQDCEWIAMQAYAYAMIKERNEN